MIHLRIKRLTQKPTRRELFFAVCGGIAAGLLYAGVNNYVRAQQTAVPYQSGGLSAKWLSPTIRHWETSITEAAERYDLDPNLIAIIMTLESGGYTKADSGQAQGLMQITPATGGDIAKKHIKQPRTSYDLFDPKTSIEFGAAYLAYLRTEFCDYSDGPKWDSCVELIAAGYNGGPGAANSLYKGEGLRDTQTLTYSRDAFNMWRERHAPSSPTYERWLERGGQKLIDKAAAEQKKSK